MSERTPAPGGLAFVEALVNTLDVETGADALDTAEGRARFGLAERSAEEAADAKELRESLRATCLAHAGHPAHREVRPLTDWLAEAPLLVKIDETGAARLTPADPDSLPARVAAAIATASAGGTWPRLKACEARTCLWAYYDRSPAGRGRWCSMQVCGARAKMRAYRSRRTS